MRTSKRQGETALQLIIAKQVATSVCRYVDSLTTVRESRRRRTAWTRRGRSTTLR